MRQEHKELSLLEKREALLGPGLGFAGNHLAKQTSLCLKTMYEAVWGHPGPSHSFCLLRADTRAKNEKQVWGLQDLGSNPGSHICVILGRCLLLAQPERLPLTEEL